LLVKKQEEITLLRILSICLAYEPYKPTYLDGDVT
jgi:hypothetical protein